MRFGVVTGLRIEAGRFAAPHPGQPIASGAGTGAAEACRRLLDGGAEALLGFGLAGGLRPEIGSGDAIIATAVRLPSGAAHACDAQWLVHLRDLLEPQPLTVRSGLLVGADRVVGTPSEKAALAAAGGLAVDTESHYLAAAAARAKRPFAVVRVVVDRAQDSLPAFLADSYGADGRLRTLTLLGGLLRQPDELPALLRLSLQGRRALAVLGRVGRLGAALGPP